MNLKELIKDIIANALEELSITYDKKNIVVEVPKDRNNGDFSSNVAMQLTKVLKSNPRNIAEEIVSVIKNNKEIEKADVAGPGFINIYLNDEYVFSGVEKVLYAADNYGKSNVGER